MQKKFFNFIFINFCLLFFIVYFLCVPYNNAFALLEVEYPPIAGQTIDENTELQFYILYLFNAGMFLGFFAVFISITIAGVMYFLSPVNVEAKTEAKDRFFGAISGLLILVLTYLVITTINPNLKNLKYNKLVSDPIETEIEKPPGVYFYTETGCPEDEESEEKKSFRSISGISNLGNFKNKINSVKVEQGYEGDALYIAILYGGINFRGKSLFIPGDGTCQEVEPFASSVSIYEYDGDSIGDGVYFFRKPCLDDKYYGDIKDLVEYCKEGGYLKIAHSEFAGGSSFTPIKLDDKFFENVPEEEKICKEYLPSGICDEDAGREAPRLSGENISSVIINGNYLLRFVYFDPNNDNPSGPFTDSQEFPTVENKNKIGPRQMKWEEIRNNAGAVPNYLYIYTIKNNFMGNSSCTSDTDCLLGKTCNTTTGLCE